MNELIAAWTRAGNAVAAYFESQVGDGGPGEPVPPAAPKKARAKKDAETAAPSAPPAAPPAPPAAVEMTENESYDELCKHVIGYIGAPAAGHEARRAFAEKHVADTYKVASLSAVPHGPQRAQLTQWFKEQMKGAAAAPAPAGFGV